MSNRIHGEKRKIPKAPWPRTSHGNGHLHHLVPRGVLLRSIAAPTILKNGRCDTPWGGQFQGNVGLFARNRSPVHWTVAMFAMIWRSWSIFHGGWMGKLFLSSTFNLLCLYRSINLVDIAQSRRNHENVMAVLAAQDLQDLHNQIELTISSIIPALST